MTRLGLAIWTRHLREVALKGKRYRLVRSDDDLVGRLGKGHNAGYRRARDQKGAVVILLNEYGA